MIPGIDKVLDVFRKLSPVPLMAMAFTSCVILFLPSSVAAWLGLAVLRSKYRLWVGLSLVVSLCYLFSHLLSKMWPFAVSTLERRKTMKERNALLSSLSSEEKGYLLFFIKGGYILELQIDDDVIDGLEKKGMVRRALPPNIVLSRRSRKWNIQPWAFKKLRAHPDLLEGAIEPPAPPMSNKI